MSFFKKWYTYQKERFPVLKYGTYIFSIVFAVFFYCSNKTSSFNYILLVPMFIVAFLQFLMVRIIDEFKDYEEDKKYRPYRPVPRGLVSLKELGILFIICAIIQMIITFLINKKGIVYLIFVWIIFAIMTKGFFIKSVLDKHILLEVLLDELLMPVLVLYLTSFIGNIQIEFIYEILLMSYFVSWIVEIARKIRCKEDEEKGVKTYTAVFGIKKAVLILSTIEIILIIIQTKILTSKYIILTAILLVLVMCCNIIFVKKQDKKTSDFVQLSANILVLACYFSMYLLVL
jgi:4-hydroxybenzoate polyprenyltransferase